MNYPSLSLKQDLIDEVFSDKKYGIKTELKQTASPGSSRLKKIYKEKKELRLQNVVVEECDQCEYKTAKFDALRFHKRGQHSDVKQRCTDCEYSHVYPNRVKIHFKQVHMGIKKGRGLLKCRRESCEFAGTTNCLELDNHSFFSCKQCQLPFERSDSLKFHNDKIHEGLVFKCEHCDIYSTARKNNLERHIRSKHSDEDSKQKRQNRNPRFCKEEGCTYIELNGQLKRHIETQHDGVIMRLKCHAVNCNFETTWTKNLKRHAQVHLPESLRIEAKLHEIKQASKSIECVEEGCNVKVRNIKKHMKIHIAQKEGRIYTCKWENCNFKTYLMRYFSNHMIAHSSSKPIIICKWEDCNFETHLKRYLLKHMRREKHQDSKPVTTTELYSVW